MLCDNLGAVELRHTGTAYLRTGIRNGEVVFVIEPTNSEATWVGLTPRDAFGVAMDVVCCVVKSWFR